MNSMHHIAVFLGIPRQYITIFLGMKEIVWEVQRKTRNAFDRILYIAHICQGPVNA
jgi:hypothetical protein